MSSPRAFPHEVGDRLMLSSGELAHVVSVSGEHAWAVVEDKRRSRLCDLTYVDANEINTAYWPEEGEIARRAQRELASRDRPHMRRGKLYGTGDESPHNCRVYRLCTANGAVQRMELRE